MKRYFLLSFIVCASYSTYTMQPYQELVLDAYMQKHGNFDAVTSITKDAHNCTVIYRIKEAFSLPGQDLKNDSIDFGLLQCLPKNFGNQETVNLDPQTIVYSFFPTPGVNMITFSTTISKQALLQFEAARNLP